MNFLREIVGSTTTSNTENTAVIQARANRTNDPEINCKDCIHSDVTIGEDAILLHSTWQGSKTIDEVNWSDTVLLETTVDYNSRPLDATLFKSVEGQTELDSEGERIMESIENSIVAIPQNDSANHRSKLKKQK